MNKPTIPWPLGDPILIGRRVLIEEADSLRRAATTLDSTFSEIVSAIVSCAGRLVVSGVGKSGHVGRKIAATFASTGTPAFFVHAAEAGHGDLGMITPKDILISISNSGESDEAVNIASFGKRFGATIVAMTGVRNSRLSSIADFVLLTEVNGEACPLGVAPTSSTTLQLAMGDALAMATLAQRGFTTADFAKTHPHGQLGRRHYLKVADVMKPISQVPTAKSDVPLRDVVSLMALGKVGAVVVLNNTSLVGIFTDSDLRRLISEPGFSFDSLSNEPIVQYVTKNPLTIDVDRLASETLEIFESKKISRLICVDGAKVSGLLAWHDLLQHKVA